MIGIMGDAGRTTLDVVVRTQHHTAPAAPSACIGGRVTFRASFDRVA